MAIFGALGGINQLFHLYVLPDEVQRHAVLSSPGNYHICVLLGRNTGGEGRVRKS